MIHVLTATNQELHREDREYIVFHRLPSKQTELFSPKLNCMSTK